MTHYEIPADDAEQAQAFYGGLFGWEFQEFPGAPGGYWMTRVDDRSGAAISGGASGGKGARTYFDVDDVRASAAKVKELGGEADDPIPVPGMGWFSTCRDPHGNDFGLWQTDENAG
ncbi:MAG TPA: VOC family protein [Gaiellaceae bacterium]